MFVAIKLFFALCATLFSVACSLPAEPLDREAVSDRSEQGHVSKKPQDRNPQSVWYRASDEDHWYFDFLVGVSLEPDYAGSDDHETELEPDARVLFKDPWNNRHSLSLGNWLSVFDLSENLAFSVNVEYENARKPSDNPALVGLDEVDATIELAPGLHYRLGEFSLAAVAQPDILGRGKGFVWFVGASYDRFLIEDTLRLATSLDLSGANDTHMQTEFGITQAESARTSYQPYEPKAALKSFSWETTLEYYLSSQWSVFAGTELEYYLGEASDSPLIADEGSEWTAGFLLGLRFSF